MKDMTKHMDAVRQMVAGFFKLVAEMSPDDMDVIRGDLQEGGYDVEGVAWHMEVLAACLRDDTVAAGESEA